MCYLLTFSWISYNLKYKIWYERIYYLMFIIEKILNNKIYTFWKSSKIINIKLSIRLFIELYNWKYLEWWNWSGNIGINIIKYVYYS